MKTYKVVGWYNDTPHDETSACYSVHVVVEAENRHMAFDAGEVELRKIAARSDSLLNWYVQEVRTK